MTRGKFAQELLEIYEAEEFSSITCQKVLAEYDRLTAVNAQLLEALKMVEWELDGDGAQCPWCQRYTFYFRGERKHHDDCLRQAAIRAAEEK